MSIERKKIIASGTQRSHNFSFELDQTLSYNSASLIMGGGLNPNPSAMKMWRFFTDDGRESLSQYNKKMGRIYLEVSSESLGAALEIDPELDVPIVINRSIRDVITSNEQNNVLLQSLPSLVNNLEERLGLEDLSDRIILKEITFNGPKGSVGIKIGRQGYQASAIARLAGAHATFEVLGEETYVVDAGLSFAVGAEYDSTQQRNGRRGGALGLWSVNIGKMESEPKNMLAIQRNHGLSTNLKSKNISQDPDLLTLDDIVREKYKALVAQCHSKREAEELHQWMKSSIQENKDQILKFSMASTDQSILIKKMAVHLKSLHRSELRQRDEAQAWKRNAQTLANFQGMIDGFRMLGTIGEQWNKSSLQTLGVVGVSVAQGVLGVAQLTGSMGLSAVSGLAAVTPVTAVIGAALTLTNLFMRKKRRGGGQSEWRLIKQELDAIFQQIQHMHRDMVSGFNQVIKNQQKTYELIEYVYREINAGLVDIYSQNLVMDQKLDDVLKDGQKNLLLRVADAERKLANHVELLASSEDLLIWGMRCNKVLQEIRDQFRFSYGGSVKGEALDCRMFPDRGNNLTGWYQVGHLQAFASSAGIQNLASVPHFIIWQNTLNEYFKLANAPFLVASRPAHSHFFSETIHTQIQDEILKTASEFESFFNGVLERDFIRLFIEFHMEKINPVVLKANQVLDDINRYHGRLAKHQRIDDVFELNRGLADMSPVIRSMQDNFRIEMSGVKAYKQLNMLAEQYNKVLAEFRLQLRVIGSIFNIDADLLESLLTEIQPCQLIPKNYYHESHYNTYEAGSYRGVGYHYLSGPAENKFHSLMLSEQLLALLSDSITDFSEKTLAYFDYVNFSVNFLNHYASEYQDENPSIDYQPAQPFFSSEREHLDNTGQIINLLNNAFADAGLYLMMGSPASGKRTLINYLNGSTYEKYLAEDGSGELMIRTTPDSIGEIVAEDDGYDALYEISYQDKYYGFYRLPGFFDDQERELNAEAALPLILSSVKAISGLMWVIDARTIGLNKNRELKSILTYYAHCFSDHPNLIGSAIRIMVSHPREGMTKNYIVNTIKTCANTLSDPLSRENATAILEAINEDQVFILDLTNRASHQEIFESLHHASQHVFSDFSKVTGSNRFESAMSTYGENLELPMELLDIEGDGNCFFASIAALLNHREGSEDHSHESIRNNAINYFRAHPEMHIGFGGGWELGTVEAYIWRMSGEGAWAEGPVIEATALAYNLCIHIIECRINGAVEIKINESEEGEENFDVFLARTGEDEKLQHYSAFIRHEPNITPTF